MADTDITYTVIGSGPGSITVRYVMGTASLDLPLAWHGEGDVDVFIQSVAPRQLLAAQLVPAADTAALVGKTGTVPPPPAPVVAPPQTTDTTTPAS